MKKTPEGDLLEKRVNGLPESHWQQSRNRIYKSVMRGGGDPFGRPFAVGTPTLTERVVRFFRQRGFFSFETMEKMPQQSANKFTRYGAAPYIGEHAPPPAPVAAKKRRFWQF